jgi:type II secretion system protein J
MIGKSRESGGFTVAELIVAMSISAVTLLSGYELFQSLKAAGDRQSEDLVATAGLVRGLDRIREDLLHAVPRTESREAIFVGNNPALDDQAQTTQLLRFYSLCAGTGDGWVRGLRQMRRVSYELVGTKDSGCLYRSTALVVGADPGSDADGREAVLNHVERIEIAFHNGQTSESSYSSDEELPASVELTVTAHGQVWSLSVKLPCGHSEGQP